MKTKSLIALLTTLSAISIISAALTYSSNNTSDISSSELAYSDVYDDWDEVLC